jgi:hypothetical protein
MCHNGGACIGRLFAKSSAHKLATPNACRNPA